MYFIVVKFPVKPEWTTRWIDRSPRSPQATRNEPGNLWFEWSRSVEDPDEFVLVEAFTDDGAGPHVNSDHFKTFVAETAAGPHGHAQDRQPAGRRRRLGRDG